MAMDIESLAFLACGDESVVRLARRRSRGFHAVRRLVW
jgi:hypothetical protein